MQKRKLGNSNLEVSAIGLGPSDWFTGAVYIDTNYLHLVTPTSAPRAVALREERASRNRVDTGGPVFCTVVVDHSLSILAETR
jgi:hypothetical protein